jgi:hypothetical protein
MTEDRIGLDKGQRRDVQRHLALEDTYIRAHWDEIYALCRLNSLPFNSTGETIQNDGVWNVYEFNWQMDAILFWDRFKGRWLRGTEFHYPERPANLPSLKPLENWPKFIRGDNQRIMMCNLYSITTNQEAIRALFRVMNRYVGNLAPMPGVFPDYPAPVVRNTGAEREMTMMRWGMPPPSRAGGFPVTNIRNTTSPHWRGWLKPENRCLVPVNSFRRVCAGAES